MAATAEASAHPPEMVGNAFLEQYYTIQNQCPENVHKFYQDASYISRPAADGSMSSATTLEGINKMILSLDYKSYQVEILTADSQASYGNGVVVLVTGYFTGKDNLKRKFSQVFFLAPGEANEYFVMNDVFRYVDGEEAASLETDIIDDVVPAAPMTQDVNAEIANRTVTDPASTTLVEDAAEAPDSNLPLDNGKISLAEKAVTTGSVDVPSQDVSSSVLENTKTNAQPALVSAVSSNQEDAPKKSYASVANALNFKTQPFQQRISSAKPVAKPKAASPSPVTSPRPSSAGKNSRHIVKGNAIFVANLPMDTTAELLRETFEKIGPIKPEGIQVRSYKQEKNCFGFVDFVSAESMQAAIKLGSIMIGNRNAHIEEKKATNDGAERTSRRGGFRNDSFKSRGGYAGRGYGRNEGDNQERYSGHPRSNGQGRGGEGHSKNYQNGGGRGPLQFQEAQVQGGKN